MATQREIDEADIRQRIERLAEAVRSQDLEAAMSFYAPDIVSFDFEPPLQHVGAAAKRRNWSARSRPMNARSTTRFTTSRSPSATTWHMRTASTGSAAH